MISNRNQITFGAFFRHCLTRQPRSKPEYTKRNDQKLTYIYSVLQVGDLQFVAVLIYVM